METKRKRGRPRKINALNVTSPTTPIVANEGRKRGRPRKVTQEVQSADYQALVTSTLKQKAAPFYTGIIIMLLLVSGITFLLLNSMKSEIISNNEHKKVQNTSDGKTASDSAGLVQQKYIVKEGDSLVIIADKFKVSYDELLSVNGITNPDSLYAGQEIVLPILSPTPTKIQEAKNTSYQGEITDQAAMTKPLKSKGDTYIVVEGDTLWSVAEKTLGDGFAWKDVAKANKIDESVELEKGTILKIPR